MSDRYFNLSVAAGVSSLSAITIYKIFKKYFQTQNTSIANPSEVGCKKRQVLVLGLEGAGKSRLLQCFHPATPNNTPTSPNNRLTSPNPTLGYSFISTHTAGVNFQFCEGSSFSLRVVSADVVVWVVDSSSPELFAVSREALHDLLSKLDRYQQYNKHSGVPVIIVAAKQDIPGHAKTEDVLVAMDTECLRANHRVHIVGTQIPDVGDRKGFGSFIDLLLHCDEQPSLIESIG